MAKFDVVTIKGKQWLGLNIDKSVGSGGDNDRGDVMLVQAMLRYTAPFYPYFGMEIPKVVPEVSGKVDTNTFEAIINFQSNWSWRLMNLDGILHSPSYEKRNIKQTYKPLMTMTYLHILCKNTAKFYAHLKYPTGITIFEPKLIPYLRYPDLQNMKWLA